MLGVDIPDEVLATVDYQEILKAMRTALALVPSEIGPFTVEVRDFSVMLAEDVA